MGFIIRLKNLRLRSAAPFLAFGFILLLALLSATAIVVTSRDKEKITFDAAARRTLAAIEGRVAIYTALLRSGAGLLAANEEIGPAEFKAFTDRIFQSKDYGGIQGIGFTRRISAEEKEAFEREMALRLEKGDFHIWPPTPRDEYHSIVYLEPIDRRNAAAIGFDMFTESTRRRAMSEARDTGQAKASGKVTLVQEIDEKKQAGFLIYQPIYRGGKVPLSVEERRRLLVGFIYSPFRVDDLLRGIFGNEVDKLLSFEIFDEDSTEPEKLLHRSRAPAGQGSLRGLFEITDTRLLVIEGHSWNVTFRTTPPLFSVDHLAALFILLMGVASGFALFSLLRSEILARRRAEIMAEELRVSKETLQESENRFRRLVEQAPLSIQVCEPDGTSLLVNEAWRRLWGGEDASGNVFQNVRLRETGALADVRRAFQGEALEFPALRVEAGTESFWVRTRVYPVRNRRGDIRQVVLIHEDITARKRLEEQLAQRAEHLAETNRIKDNFISTLSHELRTPLSAILGWITLARSGRLDPAAFDQALETVERNGNALAQLIDDLLDVSRIMTGKIKLEVKELEFGALVEASLESQRSAIDAKELGVEFQRGPQAILMTGDEIRLQQIVWNLLTNAIKFTPRGGRIRVALQKIDSHVQLSVADDGQGIDPDFLPKMFEVFRQADSSTTRGQGGLGLGLAIVKSLVELHGGTITAESPGRGQGATFRVVFPTRVAQKVEEEGHGARKERPGIGVPAAFRVTTDLKGVRVLCVDDEKDARELVRRVLELAGAEVVVASHAEEALGILSSAQHLPAVILCDIGMPGQDGYTFMRKVRLLPPEKGGRTPAAALTAFARQEDVRAALDAGFQMHLAKPVDPEVLLRAVAQLVQKRGDSWRSEFS